MRREPVPEANRSRGRVERAAAFLACAVPFCAALLRASSYAQWRGDVAVVRDLGLGAVGWGGGLSTLAAQLALWMPLGSVTYRTAFVSCVALLVAARAMFSLSMLVLRRAEQATGASPSTFAAPALSAVATLTATMAPTFQSEATVGGSTMLGVAVALTLMTRALGLTSAAERARRSQRGLVGSAFLLGALTAENAVLACVTALLCTLVVLSQSLVGEGMLGRPRISSLTLAPRAIVRWAVVSWTSGIVLFSLPCVIRAVAPNTALDLGGPFLWGGVLAPDASPVRADLFHAWTDEIGWVALGMAAFGVASLVLTKGTRALLVMVIAAGVSDMALRRALGSTEGTLAVRLVSFALVACVSTVGVYAAFQMLVRTRVPLARAGAALVVAFQATIVALATELASERSNRAAQPGAERFTDLALERLPAGAAIYANNPRTTWRVLAATIVEGRRPDLVLIASPLLHRGDVASRMLVREAAAEPLLRAVALTGSSDEFSLSEIADVRPLVVEPERGWGATEYSHLSLEGAWLRFTSEPLGPTERKVDVTRTLDRVRPLLDTARKVPGELETIEVVKAMITAHAKALLKTGNTKDANTYFNAVDDPSSQMRIAGSLDVAFASAVARLPASKAQEERLSEQAKVREMDKTRAKEAERRTKGSATPPRKR